MHFVSLLWFISEEKLEILLALFNKAENKQQQQQQQQGSEIFLWYMALHK